MYTNIVPHTIIIYTFRYIKEKEKTRTKKKRTTEHNGTQKKDKSKKRQKKKEVKRQTIMAPMETTRR